MLAFVLRPYRGAPPRGRGKCAGAAPRIRNSCYRRFRNSFLMSCLLLFLFAFYTLSDVVVRAEIATDHLIEVGGGGWFSVLVATNSPEGGSPFSVETWS